MRNLIIDIGNTRIKSAIFDGSILIDEWVHKELAEAHFDWKKQTFQQVLISSVRWTMEELSEILDFDFLFLNHQTTLPIKNDYATPHSLGLDRIAAAIGAWHMAGKQEILAIDLGSCMTVEFVDSQHRYKGGAISPGLKMRARAMHEFTAKLPLVSLENPPKSVLGDSTVSCMEAGIWFGIQFEINGQIRHFQKKYPKIKVFVCGGDAQSFDSLAKDHIFVVPNLVLHGLNCILNHNVE
ncbi:type III pantothenate kinase [Algoriphagus hitonicola]|uniref:Type III pantothenate kinase n=1 Tax=Algoriphagus hitonicola TaxID=435880 RepID=A0A1I2QKQ7_9BACT|nr:type III pantothenate kinase [Algoriphagus hitonicola]SFG29002.1 type III pantothenate kinase [Algoriphagus hitonicola]